MKRFWHFLDRRLLQGRQLSHILMVFIAVWLALASGLIALSLNTSWRLEERGMAINEAGSLRKRVFYITLLARKPGNEVALLAEYRQFESIILHLKSLHEGGFEPSVHQRLLQQKLDSIALYFQLFWNQARQYRADDADEVMLVAKAQAFTHSIDELVLLIEEDNTRNIRLLRWFQFCLLLMAWVSAFASLRLLHQLVLAPLHRLNNGIEHIRERHFSTRLDERGTSEFGQVVHGFNLMASELSAVYGNLAGLVEEKTHALRKKNYELAMLYEMTSVFQETQDQAELVKIFIDKMMAFSGAKACAVQLKQRQSADFEVVGSNGLSEGTILHMRHQRCSRDLCRQLADGSRQGQVIPILKKCDCPLCSELSSCCAFTIKSGEDELGILNLFAPEAFVRSDEGRQLIELLCSQFGVALEGLRLNQLDKQMAVLEERNLMARGLHDSIAQSLSFLNMQVQVLSRSMREGKTALVQQTLSYIDEGIKECYADVRELLSNFRVQLAREGFVSAIQSVMARFEKQTGMKVDWLLQGVPFELTDDEQLQVIFIVQEALSNVRKHARATVVQLRLSYGADYLRVEIHDNGVGFDPDCLQQKEMQGHVGTSIMRERAAKINGQLSIVSAPQQGTTVELMLYQPNTVS